MAMSEEQIAAAQRRMQADAQAKASSARADTPSASSLARLRSLSEKIKQRPWLRVTVALLLAALFSAGVQAALAPFWDVSDASKWDLRAMLGIGSILLAFFFMPALEPRSSLLSGFSINAAYYALYFVLSAGAALSVVGLESYIYEREQQRIAAIEAQALAEQQAAQRQAQAQRLAELEQAKAQRIDAINQALARFQFAANPSACGWGKLPTGFSDISYRHKVKALYKERTQKLQSCLQDEMNKNFDRYSALLVGEVGGALSWDENAPPAKAFNAVPAIMEISYPLDVCNQSCRQRLLALKTQVGAIAQARADEFDVVWKRYVLDVVNPAIRLGDEMDWELEREQREAAAAEAAYEEASRRAIREYDGGFGDMMKSISRAANTMARKVETPSSRYRRMQNEYYQHQSAKRYWESKSAQITLQSSTVKQEANVKGGEDEGCEPPCKAKPKFTERRLMCPVGTPNDGHCPQRGYGVEHCLVSPCEGECSCVILK